jgi:hypothetical protein
MQAAGIDGDALTSGRANGRQLRGHLGKFASGLAIQQESRITEAHLMPDYL